MKKSSYKNKYSKSGKKMLLNGDQVGLAPTQSTMSTMDNVEDPTLNQYYNQQQPIQQGSKFNKGVGNATQIAGYYGLMKGAANTAAGVLPTDNLYNKQTKQFEQVNTPGWSSGANQALKPLHETVLKDFKQGNYGQALGDIFTGGVLSNYQAHTGTGDFNRDKYSTQAPALDTSIHEDPYTLAKMGKGGWIQKAVNPAHKGFCSPVTKSTCTPHRKALAMTFKKHHGFHENGGYLNEGGYANFNNYDDRTWLETGGLANNMIQLEGDKHSDPSQGIDYTPDTKVEAGEGVYTKKDGSKYVFSKELGFANKFDKLKNKYSFRKNDKLTNDILDKKLNQLEQEQEIFKATQSVKDKYKCGGKMYANGGNVRQEDYYQFDTTPYENVGISPTQSTLGTMDEQDLTLNQYSNKPAYTSGYRPKTNRNNNYDLSPYLGAGMQALGDIAYYSKNYNKLNTIPEYQNIQQTDYVPEKLDSTQALANQDLETRTLLKNVPSYSGNNSATALNNMLAASAQGSRSRADIQTKYDQANIGARNQAKQFNIQNKLGLDQFNKQMLAKNQESRLQDLSQMQNVDIGHLSNIGQAGYQGMADTRAYKNQDKDREMINQLYKNYYLKDGKLYNRVTNKPIE